MKYKYSPERREQIGNLNRGKIFTIQTIEKMRTKALSKEKPNYSEQALLNMKNKSKSIILYNLDNTVYGEFYSIVEAARTIGCSDKTIRRPLKTEKKKINKKTLDC